jgi:hypothetical protein
LRFQVLWVLGLAVVIASLVAVTAIPERATATPPSSVACSYDFSKQQLNVSIDHAVADASTHYIYKVEIYRNSVLVSSYNYTSQPSLKLFIYRYNVTAANNDSIAATARCNLYGAGSDVVKVRQGVNTTGTSKPIPQLWPYHAALMVVGMVCAMASTVTVYRKQGKSWLRSHKILGSWAAVYIISGLSLGIYMVQQNTGKHFTLPHEWLGIATILMILVTIGVGFQRFRVKEGAAKWRTAHIWLCRATVILLLLNIVSGLRLAGVF